MPEIKLLPREISELIAAGEVIERPSSVIKELCENSIDAGATSITVEIKNGGVTFMRVADNGCGIKKDQIRTAFKRHATSKIKSAEDLTHIMSLGFRGEALASVCAVSRVEMLTAAEGEDGVKYGISGGEETEFKEIGCPKGTTIIIRDLFYNTPARMKFLKKDVTEGNSVFSIVERLALSHPKVAFKFIRDGKQIMNTPGDGKVMSAIYSVLGRDFSSHLIAVEGEHSGLSVKGYVCRPVNCRANRNGQYFFVNNRFVRSGTMCAALEQAYKNSAMVGKFPACVLYLSIPSETVDVNVHPAKIEVRFSDEKLVFDCVYRSVKNAVMTLDTRPELNIEKKPAAFIKDKGEQTKLSLEDNDKNTENIRPSGEGAGKGNKSGSDLPSIDMFVNPFKPLDYDVPLDKHLMSDGSANGSANFVDINIYRTDADLLERDKNSKGQVETYQADNGGLNSDGLYDDNFKNSNLDHVNDEPMLNRPSNMNSGSDGRAADDGYIEGELGALNTAAQSAADAGALNSDTSNKSAIDEFELKLIGEVFGTYIIVQYKECVYFIDKHAAHERIIFNSLKVKTEQQLLLAPLMVKLEPMEYQAVIDNLELLEHHGFSVEDFGEGNVMVRGVPSVIKGDYEDALFEIAGKLAGYKKPVTDREEDLLHSVSCKAAIKAGDYTTPDEMLYIAKTVLSNNDVMYCPHGRAVAFKLEKRDFEKQFGRSK